MKSLQNYAYGRLLESKNNILDTNFEVQPYDWRKFKAIALKDKSIKHLVHPDDDEVEFLYNPKTKNILTRYEGLEVKVYTSITASDFFNIIRGNPTLLHKYIE